MMMYRDSCKVDEIVSKIIVDEPVVTSHIGGNSVHKVWMVSSQDVSLRCTYDEHGFFTLLITLCCVGCG